MGVKIRKMWVALLVGALFMGGLGNPMNVAAEEFSGNDAVSSETGEAASENLAEAEEDWMRKTILFSTVSGGNGAETEDSGEAEPEVPDNESSESETSALGTEDPSGKDAEGAKTDGLDYVLGRPLTEEELQRQKELFDYYSHLGGGIVPPEEVPEDNALPADMREVWGTLPSKYDSRDVNGRNLVPEIRNQNPHGTCWSFSSPACL